MVAQGRGGAIVNVASIAGLTGLAGNPAYVASKHAVNGLTANAAMMPAVRERRGAHRRPASESLQGRKSRGVETLRRALWRFGDRELGGGVEPSGLRSAVSMFGAAARSVPLVVSTIDRRRSTNASGPRCGIWASGGVTDRGPVRG